MMCVHRETKNLDKDSFIQNEINIFGTKQRNLQYFLQMTNNKFILFHLTLIFFSYTHYNAINYKYNNKNDYYEYLA